MSLATEAEAPMSTAFRSSVEDLALEELGRLEGDRKRLVTELDEVKRSIRAVRTVLAATRPPQARKTGATKPQTFNISPERRGELEEFFKGNEEEVTSAVVRGQFPTWSSSYVSMALKALREEGTIRLAATSGSTQIYRSLI